MPADFATPAPTRRPFFESGMLHFDDISRRDRDPAALRRDGDKGVHRHGRRTESQGASQNNDDYQASFHGDIPHTEDNRLQRGHTQLCSRTTDDASKQTDEATRRATNSVAHYLAGTFEALAKSARTLRQHVRRPAVKKPDHRQRRPLCMKRLRAKSGRARPAERFSLHPIQCSRQDQRLPFVIHVGRRGLTCSAPPNCLWNAIAVCLSVKHQLSISHPSMRSRRPWCCFKPRSLCQSIFF
jgi:hypothetical protein